MSFLSLSLFSLAHVAPLLLSSYRVFPLYDKNNREVPLANLVCKFVFKDDSDLKLEAQVREYVLVQERLFFFFFSVLY